MAEAYIIDAVRTPVGKKNGSLAAVHPIDLGVHAFRGLFDRVDVDPGCGRRRHRRLRRRDRRPGGQHRPQRVAGGRLPRRGAGRDGRPSVRVEPAGDFLWRTGDPVGHRGHHPGRRHAEHEPDPDRVGDGGRQGVRVHLADQRVGELAAPLRRRGDLAVPRGRADRRAVEHLPRGDGAVRARPATSVRSPRSAAGTSKTRSSASAISASTRARARRRWRRWRACNRSPRAAG